jgi:hypothetical protein
MVSKVLDGSDFIQPEMFNGVARLTPPKHRLAALGEGSQCFLAVLADEARFVGVSLEVEPVAE